jgi:chromosome segregation ATPase
LDRKLVVVAMVSILAGAGIGFLFALSSLLPQNIQLKTKLELIQSDKLRLERELNDTKSNIANLNLKIEELQGKVKELISENSRLSTDSKAAKQNIESLAKELEDKKMEIQLRLKEISKLNQTNNELRKTIDKIKKIVKILEIDRKILIEMRKDVPNNRSEAKVYWENLKNVVIKTDLSLGDQIEKILARIDAYYDWLDEFPKPPSSLADYAYWYFFPPQQVIEYFDEVSEFRKRVMLAIVDDLQAILEEVG